MSIRNATFLAFLVIFLPGIAVLVVTSERTIMSLFNDMELAESRRNAERVIRAMDAAITRLGSTAEDWAYWDDCQEYLVTRDARQRERFERVNFHAASFRPIRIQEIHLFTTQGEAAWRGRTNEAGDAIIPVTSGKEEFLDAIGARGRFPPESQGLVRIGNDYHLVAVRHVHPSARPEPVTGFLVMVRDVDDVLIQELATQVLLPLEMGTVDQNASGVRVGIQSLDRETSRVRVRFDGMTGIPLFHVAFDAPRAISALGERMTMEMILMFAFTGMVWLGLCWLALHRLVLVPLERLTRHVDQVVGTRDFGLRFGSRANNEFGLLARSFDELVAAVEIGNRALEAAVRTDALTGISNRRAFDEGLELHWKICRRLRLPISLVMLDVDFFKPYNDRFGHQAGDRCLRTVAEVLRSSVSRGDDIVARYGGEEFAMILPRTDADGVRVVMDLVFRRMAAAAVPHPDGITGVVTLSAGVASMPPEDSEGWEGLIALADARLYQAKLTGRNRVIWD